MRYVALYVLVAVVMAHTASKFGPRTKHNLAVSVFCGATWPLSVTLRLLAKFGAWLWE